MTLPKVESAAQVRLLDEGVSELEAERGLTSGHTRFLAPIESAEGVAKVEDIAGSSRRLISLKLGSEDFALANGVSPTEEVLTYPKQRLVFAARSAGFLPLGFLASIAAFSDRRPSAPWCGARATSGFWARLASTPTR